MTPYTVDLTHPAAADAALVGGKVSGLAQLARSQVRVPPTFALTRRAFDEWLATDDAAQRVTKILHQADDAGQPANDELEQRVLAILEDLPLPEPAAKAVREAYEYLGTLTQEATPLVAVRSSATSEDSAGNSFAGEYTTFLEVQGAEDVVAAARACWLSAFRKEALAYAATRQVDVSASAMAVAIQAMVCAKAAGVLFTLNPVSGDRSKILVEGTRGLGLAVVGGEVTPERFVLDKITLSVDGTAAEAEPCLTPEELAELGSTAKRLEREYGHPLDLEWAIDERWRCPESVVFVQCRPETVWSKRARSTPFDAGGSTVGWITANLIGHRPHPLS
jgi:pyruvate,water dikinase